MEPKITLTDSAVNYIKKMLLKEDRSVFRISVKKTGCSGYSYLPSIIKEVKIDDTPLIVNGITIYVDTAWMNLLEHLHIDYIEENKSGIMQKHLTFTNPKESSRCGCGESFHVE